MSIKGVLKIITAIEPELVFHELFLLRPLEKNEFIQVNLLTDWDYQFSFAGLSDRSSYKTNDKTSKIFIQSWSNVEGPLYFHLIHVFSSRVYNK